MIERKTFTYDGQNSADFGLYISGDSVYDAPTRDMDMITIPGRNGQLSIDQGRFENITVTYPAFIWADTQAEFRQKVRAIRNWLTPKHSYYRLTDEYNPESFRLGIYKSGLEVDPVFFNRAGRFELSFDCKPQRFLFTGEEVFTLGEWGETETYSGSIVSFDGTETTAIKSLKVNIVPKQSGSGDPSPSNVRAISGWDAVETTRCGKNILQLPSWAVVNSLETVGSYKRLTLKVKPNADYYLNSKAINGYTPSGRYRYVLVTNNPTGDYPYVAIEHHSEGISNGAITSTADGHLWLLISPRFTETQWSELKNGIETQLELGTTATDYEPYEGETITTNLPQTVYGGTLDVVSGELNITHKLTTFNGSESWGFSAGSGKNRVNLSIADAKRGAYSIDIWGNYIKGTSEAMSMPNEWQGNINNLGALLLGVPTSITSADSWESYLANNLLTIVYPLATTTELTLTPTEVKTLLGANNIWADAGTVEVEVGENPNILVNPTPFTAQPVFEVEGSGTLTVGNVSMTIANNGTTIIDSEMMEAYEEENGAIISRNDTVSGEFPTLKEGNNNIGTVGLTSVKVTPRWWEL